jgi:hypothetical protein
MDGLLGNLGDAADGFFIPVKREGMRFVPEAGEAPELDRKFPVQPAGHSPRDMGSFEVPIKGGQADLNYPGHGTKSLDASLMR